jgi:hypothetical protein
VILFNLKEQLGASDDENAALRGKPKKASRKFPSLRQNE